MTLSLPYPILGERLIKFKLCDWIHQSMNYSCIISLDIWKQSEVDEVILSIFLLFLYKNDVLEMHDCISMYTCTVSNIEWRNQCTYMLLILLRSELPISYDKITLNLVELLKNNSISVKTWSVSSYILHFKSKKMCLPSFNLLPFIRMKTIFSGHLVTR